MATVQVTLPTQEPSHTEIGSLIRTDVNHASYPSNVSKWNVSDNTLTFSFPTDDTAATYPAGDGVSQAFPLDEALETAIRKVFANQFATVIPINFVEVAETIDDQGTIRIMLAKLTSPYSGGQARFPGNAATSGDVQLSAGIGMGGDLRPSDVYATLTNPNYPTIIHEIGHALGLSHPGNYNAGDEPDPNAPGPFLPLALDNVMNTIMSYNMSENDSVVTTLMPHDIQALQYLYGTNTSFNDSDTIYTLSFDTWALADESVSDMRALTLNLAGKRTIWDGGGRDTIEATNLPIDNYYFDLSPGGLLAKQDVRNGSSYTGQPGQAQSGVTYSIDKAGVRLAFNMQIEDLLGTAGNDEVLGNASDNFLFGGGGNDLLSGREGADIITGNQGADHLSGGNGDDVLMGGFHADTVCGDAGDDVISGNVGEDLLNGGDGNDVLLGGLDRDTLIGGMGNDTLSGDLGQDVLTGDAGADVFVLRSAATTTDLTQADIITDFTSDFPTGTEPSDKIGLSAGVIPLLESATLNGVTGTLIRNGADQTILGFVNTATIDQLTGQFITGDF